MRESSFDFKGKSQIYSSDENQSNKKITKEEFQKILKTKKQLKLNLNQVYDN
jgi:hypothetical protein